MEELLYVSVVGAGSCGPGLEETAREVGRLLAKAGFGLVCGGLGGVMAAACQGAKEHGGVTLGILPGDDRRAANPHVDVAVATGLAHMRNYLVALNGNVMIAVGGGAGTLSEMALASKIGRPVVALGTWADLHGKLPGIASADTPEDAVAQAARLASRRQDRK